MPLRADANAQYKHPRKVLGGDMGKSAAIDTAISVDTATSISIGVISHLSQTCKCHANSLPFYRMKLSRITSLSLKSSIQDRKLALTLLCEQLSKLIVWNITETPKSHPLNCADQWHLPTPLSISVVWCRFRRRNSSHRSTHPSYHWAEVRAWAVPSRIVVETMVLFVEISIETGYESNIRLSSRSPIAAIPPIHPSSPFRRTH
jgi:hypothetical protein